MTNTRLGAVYHGVGEREEGGEILKEEFDKSVLEIKRRFRQGDESEAGS